jgi:alpha-mannosidase
MPNSPVRTAGRRRSLHGGAAYPYRHLNRIWQDVLTLQFHDILPGTSIAWVNREARETYDRVRAELEALIAAALSGLGPGRTAVLNAAPHPRAEVVVLDAAVTPSVPAQPLPGGRAAVWATAPALGAGAFGTTTARPVTIVREPDGLVLDNCLLRVTIDADGLIASAADTTTGREVIAPGRRGNLLQLHPDHPNNWDAWDIDVHYRNSVTDLTAADAVTVEAEGPLLAAVQVVRTFGASRLVQTYRLTAGSRRLDMDTTIDWAESNSVLKAAFPLDVYTDRAAAEIQFGHLYRPIHTNTSWDDARFEIWAHRWLHVGEPGYGVALLNDATYGHDVTRLPKSTGAGATNVRLTLVRAPHSPDPHADQGTHRLTYALMPAADIADAVVEGYRLNLPLRSAEIGAPPPLITVTDPGIVVEAVKLADDRTGDLLVRLYEAHGRRADTLVTAALPIRSAHQTDLLERPRQAVSTSEHGVRLQFGPFQIITLRLSIVHR